MNKNRTCDFPLSANELDETQKKMKMRLQFNTCRSANECDVCGHCVRHCLRHYMLRPHIRTPMNATLVEA